LTENDQTSPAGKFEFGANDDLAYVAGRAAADNGFERIVEWSRVGDSNGAFMSIQSTGALRFEDMESSYIGFRAPDLAASWTHDLWSTSSNVGLLLTQTSNSGSRPLAWSNTIGASGSSVTFSGGLLVSEDLTVNGAVTLAGGSEWSFSNSTASLLVNDTTLVVGLADSSMTVHGDLEVTGHLIDKTTHSFTVTLSSGTGWDSLAVPFARAPHYTAITITEVYAESLPAGSSVQYRIEERAQGSVNSTGTDVFTVTESTANGTGVTETGFDNAGIAAKAGLVFVTDTSAAAGDPDLLTLTVFYTKDE
jgi:hypothetical protein